jgi:chemotaxis protein MotA
MDIATVLGLMLGVALIVGSISISGGSFLAFYDLSALVVVFGGAVAVALISYPLKNFVGVLQVFLKSIFYQVDSIPDLNRQLTSLAVTARRHGLLALEKRIPEIDNPFVSMGIQLAVDGTRPEVIEDILRTEMDAVATRHRDGKAVLDCMGRFAPAFGMIGTLMGLVMMLGNMSDLSSIGSGMAVALLTTLYGAVAANILFLPVAEKLGYINRQELMVMEIAIRGILAIQSGEHPRIIEQQLNTFVAPNVRAKERRAA